MICFYQKRVGRVFSIFQNIFTVKPVKIVGLLRADAHLSIRFVNVVARHNTRKAHILGRKHRDGGGTECGKPTFNQVDRVDGKQRAAIGFRLMLKLLCGAADVEKDNFIEPRQLARIGKDNGGKLLPVKTAA